MIQKLLAWIRQTFSPSRSKTHVDLRQTGVRARPPIQRAADSLASTRTTSAPPKPPEPPKRPEPPTEIDPATLEFDGDVGLQIDDLGPGKNVMRRSKYIREDAGTHDTLKIIDENELEVADDDGGIDPYNTGKFDRPQSWKKRSHD